MFNLERGLRYWLYSEPTDMRKSFHTLSGLVRNKIGGDPMNGDVYIFVNKRRNRIKLLHYETGGLSLCIECLQLLLRVGFFELTDLVMNTLGAFGGAFGLVECYYRKDVTIERGRIYF